MVAIKVSSSAQLLSDTRIGRVGWGSLHLWPDLLASIGPILACLTYAVWRAASEMGSDINIPIKRRRQVLEAAAWVREALYCFIGHAGQLIKVSLPRKRKRAETNVPPPYSSQKEEVKSRLEAEKLKRSHEFAELHKNNPAKASAFVSSFFKRQRAFQIALRDDLTGEDLSGPKAADFVAADLFARGNPASSEDDGSSGQLHGVVVQIRNAGAPIEGVQGLPKLPDVTTGHNPMLYDMLELEACLKNLRSNKQAVHNPLAAIKAACEPSRQLTLSLTNLGRVCRLSPALWSSRVISPLRKGGPRTVTSIKWLRPVSQASDMSAIQDSLWLARCKPFLETFSGFNQFGGKYDAIALVLAVLLHVQIRDYQGLLSYVLFADLKHAFDVANKDLMLYMSYLAGITATEWLLLYDFFDRDRAAVQVGGFLTGLMKFAAGIPQGRRFSLHTFTAAMHALRMIMESVCPTSCTILPPFAREALETTWERLATPKLDDAWRPYLHPSIIAESVRGCLEAGWYDMARVLACSCLQQLPLFHDRVRCMEALGKIALGPLFFVDDIIAVYPDATSIDTLTNGGLQSFTRMTRTEFNFGPGKTATMACFNAPPADFHVDRYKLLGIEVGPDFCFEQRLNIVTAKGRACFDEFYHLAESSGFSIALMTFEVVRRIVPLVMYGAELLISIPTAERRLNQLQGYWAKTIVGARSRTDVRANLAIQECGWELRLGTLMLEKAFLCLARLQLLPPEHPSRRLLEVALELPCRSWARDVVCLLNHPGFSSNIPQVHESEICPSDMFLLAYTDSAVRRNILRNYRDNIVRPILLLYDETNFGTCATKMIPGLQCQFFELESTNDLMKKLLPAVLHWRVFRIWLIIRMTGQWPICLYEPESNVDVLDECPFCFAKLISVRHAILDCPHRPDPPSGVRELQQNIRCLFDERLEGPILQKAISFVGQSVHKVLVCSKVVPNSRLDQWLHDFGTVE